MSLARLKPLYVSLFVSNTAYDIDQTPPRDSYDVTITPETTIYAIVNQVFNDPIVPKASDYLVAIERLELNLNGIPFYNGTPAETIYVTSRADNTVQTAVVVNLNAYSLTHLFEQLNSMVFRDPTNANPLTNTFRATFAVNKDGFVVVTLLGGMTFTSFVIDFPRRLNMILGISRFVQFIGETACKSSLPRIDMGDDLDHLILRTNLPVYSDSLGNVKTNVMTDFAVPSVYSNSMSYGANGSLIAAGFTTNMRQKVIYNPTERRYLELVGDFPIQQISIECIYVDPSHDVKRVIIPFGGIFEVKLGFYLKQ